MISVVFGFRVHLNQLSQLVFLKKPQIITLGIISVPSLTGREIVLGVNTKKHQLQLPLSRKFLFLAPSHLVELLSHPGRLLAC